MNAANLGCRAQGIGVQDVDPVIPSGVGIHPATGLHQHRSQLPATDNSYACHARSFGQKKPSIVHDL